MEGEENSALGKAIAEEPATSRESRAWYVAVAMPHMHDSPRYESMWCPGGGLNMIVVSLTRKGALAEAHFDRLMSPPRKSVETPLRLFEFNIRLDAVLDLSAPKKLAKFGLTMPTLERFYDIHDGVRRLEVEDVIMRQTLIKIDGAIRKVDRVTEQFTRADKVTNVASCVGFEGMLVPSLRHDGLNLVVFYHSSLCDRQIIAHDTIRDIVDLGPVNWSKMPSPKCS